MFLDQYGLRPQKRLSQNFLIDGNIVQKIVTLAKVNPGDLILEVGPGPGALTQALLEAGVELVAVEKDPLFAQALHRYQTTDRRLTVVNQDILKFPLESLKRPATVVANLPYHLTTPILTRLIPRRDHFHTLVVMVQHEVAQRLIAPFGSVLYGFFACFLQVQAHVELSFKVNRSCFYPVPNVDSAVIKLDLIRPAVKEPERFLAFVRQAFSQRRKMIKNLLNDWAAPEQVQQALRSLGYLSSMRAEDLPPDALVSLFNALTSGDDATR